MNRFQPGILSPLPPLARYLLFSLKESAGLAPALVTLRDLADGDSIVIGIGHTVVKALDREVSGLRDFPDLGPASVNIPSGNAALWCWLRGEDRGQLYHLSRHLENTLSPTFKITRVIDAFLYGPGLDLTGYEDGTENPQGDDAVNAAFVSDAGEHLAGSSFVAVQQWVHDMDGFEAMSREQQDNTIGRRRSDNEELDEAPASAHVKRTAQESFDPEAFVLRRSMPWADETRAGLVFVAFGNSFDAFEAQLNRMAGKEDGIVDALFTFTRPVSGNYFWCPPMSDEGLDLALLDI